MAYKPKKTDNEWKQIRFQNSLGPQIGGLTHDAVALTIAGGVKGKTFTAVQKDIREWLNRLYEIAELKKDKITTPKPVSKKDIKIANEEFEEVMKEDETEAINEQVQREMYDEGNPVEEIEERNYEEQKQKTKR